MNYMTLRCRASENIFRLQCKRGSSKWASPHHKQFAAFLRNFYIFKQLLGNFEIWASVRRTRRTLFSDALLRWEICLMWASKSTGSSSGLFLWGIFEGRNRASKSIIKVLLPPPINRSQIFVRVPALVCAFGMYIHRFIHIHTHPFFFSTKYISGQFFFSI